MDYARKGKQVGGKEGRISARQSVHRFSVLEEIE
jgi:hypothetical protein